MIRVFMLDGDQIRDSLMPIEPDRLSSVVWIDLLRPTEAEREEVNRLLHVDLPTLPEMQEIEASSRTYTEAGAYVLTTPVIAKVDSQQPETGVLTFVLAETALVTVRYLEPRPIDVFMYRLARQPAAAHQPTELMIGLIEALIDRSADTLELANSRLESLSRHVFITDKRPGSTIEGGLTAVLRELGRSGELIGKVRDALAGMDRIVAFVTATPLGKGSKEYRASLKTVARDIRSLIQHAEFQSQRLTFLLDATLGVINVEQTNIVKIFSVATASFLPPTLIASIYGMNFAIMPELAWTWGYPFALALMLASAVLPLWYFRRKGWL
jgi:magnesium transporter